jgi:hypothetical protein
MSVPVTPAAPRLRPADALLVVFGLGHGALLLAVPTLPIIAIGLWWNSNTIAHYFLHRPFFGARWADTLFALYLSVLLGIPQSVWRDRHLAHHAGRAATISCTPRLAAEVALITALWIALLVQARWFFLGSYVPGYLVGLALCALQGHFEHWGGHTVSHHGRLYNRLFFNDGYHIEHHADPTACWTALPRCPAQGCAISRWPAVLQWLDLVSLESLERLALRSRTAQRFLLDRHARALATLSIRGPVRHIAIVGGGLFPRSAILMRRLFPLARLVIIDASAGHLDIARGFLDGEGEVEFVRGWYDPARHTGFDVVTIPLAYKGDRAELYRDPPADQTLIHDWLWRRRGEGRVVSWLLLKRLNLVRR